MVSNEWQTVVQVADLQDVEGGEKDNEVVHDKKRARVLAVARPAVVRAQAATPDHADGLRHKVVQRAGMEEGRDDDKGGSGHCVDQPPSAIGTPETLAESHRASLHDFELSDCGEFFADGLTEVSPDYSDHHGHAVDVRDTGDLESPFFPDDGDTLERMNAEEEYRAILALDEADHEARVAAGTQSPDCGVVEDKVSVVEGGDITPQVAAALEVMGSDGCVSVASSEG